MKREDIIAMAREAGCHHSYRYTGTSHKRSVYRFHNTELERFAQLVAAAEREACAKVCEEERDALLWREGQTLPRGEPRLIHMASTASQCAAAIRAGGNT